MTLITNGEAVFTGNIGTTLGFIARNEARMDRATVVLDALRGTPANDISRSFPIDTMARESSASPQSPLVPPRSAR